MKYIKLVVLMALMGGLFYGVTIWSDRKDGGIPHPDEDKYSSLLEDLRSQVEQEWDSVSKWDSQVYRDCIAKISLRKRELEAIKTGNFETLIDYTNEIVCNKLMAFLDSSFRQENCTQKNILEHKTNIQEFLTTNSSIDEKDKRIKTAFRRIQIYNAALSFSRKTFSLQPQFDIDDDKWTPTFIEYRDSIKTMRDSHIGRLKEVELYHITEVKNALKSVDDKLVQAREQYAINLSAKIVLAFKPIERTYSNYNKYRKVAKIFYEYDNGELSDNFILQDDRDQFKEDVERENLKLVH